MQKKKLPSTNSFTWEEKKKEDDYVDNKIKIS